MRFVLEVHWGPVDCRHLVDNLGPLLPAERRLTEGETGRVADQARGLELITIRPLREFQVPGRVRRLDRGRRGLGAGTTTDRHPSVPRPDIRDPSGGQAQT